MSFARPKGRAALQGIQGAGRDDQIQPYAVLIMRKILSTHPLHPRAVSLELAQLAPAATLVEAWKTQPRRYLDAIQDFLARHPA